MITIDRYKKISKNYGDVCSWAIWEKAGDKPTSNISKMDIFDLQQNPTILKSLQTNIIMVGLNFSRDVKFTRPFMNFHDGNPCGKDYKIRHAFEGTDYYGAYMTDVIKDLPVVSSSDVFNYLQDNPVELESQLERFRNELDFINKGAKPPTILAFGQQVHNILKRGLKKTEYNSLIRLIHYSHFIGKEDYREDCHRRLGI